ncbi:MAG: hypothetical protein JNK99_06980 [Candidatus Accumulibacter sp.]|uniref:hypothetical protein n=1 Tax=Accumulibacter sp. TaxID=2053492 RepID=UPI001A5E4406|nr:hypothetical protein [Accumulibacter sp.]MBL8394485.1 hypothetical protein [Accumulibacter sp.]
MSARRSKRWRAPLAVLASTLVGLAGGVGGLSGARAAEVSVPQPVVDPSAPGENLPGRGRSLFDQLFAVKRGNAAAIDLPFPFAALLARLDAQLQGDPASPLPPAKRVLIPLGRSLQRTAAAPDYFVFPRVVVAVDSPPASGTAPLLKDRLYLGYQERSAVLEVISYNEEAGRFEFQLVKDYRAGGKPRVFYANRMLCFACHQNGSPIFARALWDETNANPRVAAQLLATGRNFYGIEVRRGVDVPYTIDNATERANGLALTQRVWREGCGSTDATAQRCRAGLFAAALRHALSGGQSWTADPAFAEAVSRPLRAEAQRRWPAGLAVGNPDLPNRNPLHGDTPWPVERAGRIAMSHIDASFDPLLPRKAREIWRAEAPDALRPLISGLAEFVAAPDQQRLVAWLARSGRAATSETRLPCRIEENTSASRWSLHCTAAGGATLESILTVRAGRPATGHLTRLTLPGGTALNGVELNVEAAVRSARATGARRMTLRPHATVPGSQELRTAAGDAIIALELERAAGSQVGALTLRLRRDFAIVQQAIDRLVASQAATSLFGPSPLPRQKLFAALFAELGAPLPPPCCQAAEALPPPQLEVPAVAPGTLQTTTVATDGSDAAARRFQPYCAACHLSAETFPPNFLQGTPDQVASKLRHCAPRLYVRLAMADEAPERRTKTPMPPESLLPAFGTDSRHWRDSPERGALLAQVAEWLRAETGQAPQLERLLAAGYEALRPCLPVQ